MTEPLRLPALYAIVDPLDTGRPPEDLAAAYLAGGARLLQLRAKDASSRELLRAAERIVALARAAGALFLVNDRPDVARAVDADGVHLGQDDLPVAAARRALGPSRLVGVSTHDLAEARAAVAAGADYIGVGPIYATTSKEKALPARGLDLVATVRAEVRCPIVAIGGITAETAPAVRAAGADAVAMIAALARAADPEAEVRRVIAALSGAPSPPRPPSRRPAPPRGSRSA
jgi:thiamine-phosphate pyrophosphorylase